MMSSGIGNFLRQYRQNNNLSRESFAEMLDISVAFLAAIELGTKKPAYDTLIKIINTLKVSADEALLRHRLHGVCPGAGFGHYCNV